MESPSTYTQEGAKDLAVHEEGLEPPHLAVPEPKFRGRVARGSERTPTPGFGG